MFCRVTFGEQEDGQAFAASGEDTNVFAADNSE